MDIKNNEETQKDMIERTNDINTIKKHNMDNISDEQKSFSAKVTKLNVLACNFAHQENIGLAEAEKQSQDGLKVLGVQGGVEEMLAAQMIASHNLQQLCMAMANKMLGDVRGQYFINSAIKLSNSFTNQAALLSKLQGNAGQQRIVVEHIEVHHGAQAIVGNINKGSS
jgi:hypothetical protein